MTIEQQAVTTPTDGAGSGGGPPRRSSGGGRGGGRRGEYSKRYPAKRKVCMFCVDKVTDIDYKDLPRLRRHVSERGKIEPRRKTGACAKHQRALALALKRARHVALLPYTADHIRLSGVVIRSPDDRRAERAARDAAAAEARAAAEAAPAAAVDGAAPSEVAETPVPAAVPSEAAAEPVEAAV